MADPSSPSPPPPPIPPTPLTFPETPWDFPDRALKELFSDRANLRDLVEVAAPDYAPFLNCLGAKEAKTEEIASLIPGWPKFLSDLVFDVPIIDPNAKPGEHLPLGVLVVENQSKAESDVIPRAFAVIAGRWMRRLREWDGKAPFEHFGLPAAASIIVHTGLDAWKGPRTLSDLVKGPPPMRQASPRFDPVFWEVRNYTADQLLGMKQELFRGMAVIRAQDHSLKTFRKVLGSSLERLKDLAKADRARWAKLVQFVMWWSFHRRKRTEQGELRNTVAAVYRNEPVEREVNLMAETIAEYYYKQGEASGFKSGEASGFKSGEASGFKSGEASGFKSGEAKAKADDRQSAVIRLSNFIHKKFQSPLDADMIDRLKKAENLDSIMELYEEALLAQTREDFLAKVHSINLP